MDRGLRRVDVAIVGAGAAGLMAAIVAGARGRSPRGGRSTVALDGARTLGAKILVSGGGRCNVTHDVVEAGDFHGASAPAVRKVLRRFEVADTVAFFAARGVRLDREDTGKLFPAGGRARSVLDALLAAASDAGAEIVHPWRVLNVERSGGGGFVVEGPSGRLVARRVVLATGGRALPKSGSDGHGYEIARRLGHTTTPIFPALTPLVLEDGSVPRSLPGVAAPCRLEVRDGKGRRVAQVSGAVLCTHFGVSGPGVLDVSRHLLAARLHDADAHLVISWLPGLTVETLDAALRREDRGTPRSWLRARLPERLADALIRASGVDPIMPLPRLAREARLSLAGTACAMRLPVTADRGYNHAEVTAGGVPLSEVRLETMESRITPGLYLCGEILDVDGPIGGYNFQWAWASGHVAGQAAGE